MTSDLFLIVFLGWPIGLLLAGWTMRSNNIKRDKTVARCNRRPVHNGQIDWPL